MIDMNLGMDINKYDDDEDDDDDDDKMMMNL